MARPYQDWEENEIRNAIWHLSESSCIRGGRTDAEELRVELRIRGLDTEGYHNT